MGCKNIEFRVPTIAIFSGAILWLGSMVSVHASDPSELIITESTTLDPNQTYSRIIIKASNITLDGKGAWLIGKTEGKPSEYQGTAIVAHGVSGVTLKNIHAKGWEIGLHVTDGSDWLVEGCDFSNNFHDPDFGWGENGRRGGMIFHILRTPV